jgi:hypothetical protein
MNFFNQLLINKLNNIDTSQRLCLFWDLDQVNPYTQLTRIPQARRNAINRQMNRTFNQHIGFTTSMSFNQRHL